MNYFLILALNEELLLKKTFIVKALLSPFGGSLRYIKYILRGKTPLVFIKAQLFISILKGYYKDS